MRKIYTAIAIMCFALGSFANQSLTEAQVSETLGTDILEFTITDQVSGTIINTAGHTVLVTMPFGTDLTALVPTYTMSAGATSWIGTKQVSSTVDAIDFSSPVTYTIKNSAKSEQAWVVSVAIEEPVAVTFNVDMSAQTVNEGDFWLFEDDVVNVVGSFNGWDITKALVLEDADGDNIYSVTINNAKNDSIAYKYVLNGTWDQQDGHGVDRSLLVKDADIESEDVWVAIVNKPISVNENALSLVSMYPNPVSSELTIANLEGVNKVVVSNLLGQALVTKNVSASTMTINTADFKAGIYVVTVVSANGATRSERIVKE